MDEGEGAEPPPPRRQMINLTTLWCGGKSASDSLRYGVGHGAPKSAAERRPVVVWNITRGCNLRCVHCYSDSRALKYPGELSTAEAKEVLRQLADFGVPAVLFSGGEPLLRRDLFALADHARRLGLRCTLSTNGTLIDEAKARKIRESGFTYAGVSIDGVGKTNDMFRGVPGAFDRALQGIRNLRAVGQRVGLRMTLTRWNIRDLDAVFDLIEREGIARACFYHLVYAGRGSDMRVDDLNHKEARETLDLILRRTQDFHERGLGKEILTVDNHADGVYAYLKLSEHGDARAEEIRDMLKWNGGGTYSSGVGIGCIDWNGNVHPDQFWHHHVLGNVKNRSFGEIWMDISDPIMAGLKNRLPLLKGRCGACKYKELCGGSFRVRAEAVYGDPWAADPACYLVDEEIGVTTDGDRQSPS